MPKSGQLGRLPAVGPLEERDDVLPRAVDDRRMSLSGTAIPIQCLVAVNVMFFVAVSHVVSCRCGRRTLPACTFCHGTVGSGAFFLDRRPSLLRIPLVGGLPCGGGYLREEGLHGFLCPAVAAATGPSLAGCLPAKRRL